MFDLELLMYVVMAMAVMAFLLNVVSAIRYRRRLAFLQDASRAPVIPDVEQATVADLVGYLQARPGVRVVMLAHHQPGDDPELLVSVNNEVDQCEFRCVCHRADQFVHEAIKRREYLR